MKRDMDLARQILLAIEERSNDSKFSLTTEESEKQTLLNYHIGLLSDAHLIQATRSTYLNGSKNWYIEGLTWQGHDFLEAVKNETIWQKTKKFIRDRGGAVTFEVAKTVATQLALKQVGL